MKRPAFSLCAAIMAASAPASAETTLVWQAPSDACPTEAEVRAWLAQELSPARAAASMTVVATVVNGPDGWTGRLQTRRPEGERVSAVRAPDCVTLSRLVVQEIVFDAAVLSDPATTRPLAPVAFVTEAPYVTPELDAERVEQRPVEAPRLDAPAPVAMRERQRFSLDVGVGAGAAYLSGTLTYAEQFTNATTGQLACGALTCYRTVDPGVAMTWYGYAALRWHPTRRVAVGLTARLQADAADWSVAPPNGVGASKSNPLANLLVTGRVYYALTSQGFATRGASTSLFAGVGAGQIEPRPSVPAGVTRESAHVVSGYFEAHAGVRYEYAFAENVHVGAEFTAHLLFPTALFDLDITAVTGVHF